MAARHKQTPKAKPGTKRLAKGRSSAPRTTRKQPRKTARQASDGKARGAGFTDGLRDRMAELVKGIPQAQVARVTASSQSSIAHYLKGRKVPAEFCSALARAYDVNPGWLLTGRGSRAVSSHPSLVGEHLFACMDDLTQALGALKDIDWLDPQSHALRRECADLLEQWRDAQRSVDENVALLCQRLVQEYRTALQTRRTPSDAADHALERFQKLHASRDFAREATETLALADEVRADADGAAARLHKALREAIAARGQLALDQLGLMRRIAILPLDAYRITEAQQVVRAALAAWEDVAGAQATADWHTLRFLDGILTMENGEADKGFESVDAGYFELEESVKHTVREHYMLSLLYNGYLSLADCIGADEAMLPDLSPIQRNRLCTAISGFAIWHETIEEADLALEVYTPVAGPRLEPEATFVERYLRLLRRALDKKAERTDFDAIAAPVAGHPVLGAVAEICRCQFERLLGDDAAARATLERADAKVRAFGKKLRLRMAWRALHFRNMLALFPKDGPDPERYRRAIDFFNAHYLKGCGCFRNLATESLLLF